LLGGFGLTIDGADTVMTPAAQRLLAFVALTPRGAERAFTAFQLWPEHCEKRAKANLRSALWRLGKAPANLIIATKCQLRLDPEVWVDARHGIGEVARGGVEEIAEAVLPFHALDSDLLPDWYDDWLMVERERLRQFRLGSLEEAATRAIGAGQFPRAIQLALASVAIEPLRQSAHLLVIEAHAAQGNRVEAIRQFETLRTLLRTRLDCEPGTAATELMASISAQSTTGALIAA
jgi:DNA-binding SARP family transcriptional activator